MNDPPIPDTVRLGYSIDGRSDKNLISLLKEHFGVGLGDTYATNLFPFIKRGGMSAPIPSKDLVRAANEFAWPQIEIIAPRLVIALGFATFNALCKARGIAQAAGMDAAISHPVDEKGIRVWCQSHPGDLGRKNRGGKENVRADWQAMASWYRSGQ